jgi:archaellum component FlaF (FlaF/FlaG flagellin family)
MGASVGIGGLIVGVSMLVVFSMAYQSIALQIDSGLDRIENADEPLPTFTMDDAELWEGAVVDITINSGGSGYSDGTFEADPNTGGLFGTFTTSGGAIDDVVITSHGNYSSAPTLKFNCNVPCTPSGPAPTYTIELGNVIYANLTNTGSTTISHDDMWLFVDGVNATSFSDAFTSPIASELWFSGETLSLQWMNADVVGSNRLTLTAGTMTVSHTLA